MRSQMYIPETITVGFQKRSDTFTGKLAYVVYHDHKGKLRKETSWNGWRDKTIEPVTLKNVPTSGCTFNKGVQRDGYWGSGRSVIRVWDPRDFEFEISVDNLIGILMHSDVSKRDITEPCVFAWYGTELVLLPTNSVEYQESVKFTENQSKKFNTKDLVIGHTYKPRTLEESVVYVGRHKQYEIMWDDDRTTLCCKEKRLDHAFIGVDSNRVYFKSPSAFIAHVEQEEVHANFPALMDKFYHKSESQPLSLMRLKPVEIDATDAYYRSWFMQVDPVTYVRVETVSSYGMRNGPPVLEARLVYTWDDEKKCMHRINCDYPGRRNYSPWYSTMSAAQQTPDHVKKYLEEVNAQIRAAYPAPTGKDHYNNDVYDDEAGKQAYISVLNTHQIGSIEVVLADGKVAKNYNFYG